MSFLTKIEAKYKPTKPKRVKKSKFGVAKANKPFKPKKATKPQKFEKAGRAATAKINLEQTNFIKIRNEIPNLKQFLTEADIFDMQDPTWAKFFHQASPRIMTMLLWDLGVITRQDVPAMIRFFKQRVKGA